MYFEKTEKYNIKRPHNIYIYIHTYIMLYEYMHIYGNICIYIPVYTRKPLAAVSVDLSLSPLVSQVMFIMITKYAISETIIIPQKKIKYWI